MDSTSKTPDPDQDGRAPDSSPDSPTPQDRTPAEQKPDARAADSLDAGAKGADELDRAARYLLGPTVYCA